MATRQLVSTTYFSESVVFSLLHPHPHLWSLCVGQIYEDSIVIQSVFTSAREKLEKEGFTASSSDSDTEEEEAPRSGKARRSVKEDDDEEEEEGMFVSIPLPELDPNLAVNVATHKRVWV